MLETVGRTGILLLFLVLACSVYGASPEEQRFFKAIASRDVATVRAMLDANPQLLNAKRPNGASAVLAAFLSNQKGFLAPPQNEVLAAVLRRKPTLDIFEASGVGDIDRVRELLSSDPSLATSWSSVGWTPLHFAAFGGNVDVLNVLMKQGAASQVNARAKTKFLNTPLQAALLTAQYGTTKYLLEHGADVLVRQSQGFTPLQLAAESGRRDLTDLLLEHGAEINSRTDDGRNAYTEALRFGHKELAEYLKSKGAMTGEIGAAQLMTSPD